MARPQTTSRPEHSRTLGLIPGRWREWIREHEITVVAALLVLCCFFLFYDFLLGNKLYLFKDIGQDSLNTFYPRYVHLSRYLRTWGLPGWSFNIGLGQDAFPFSMGNPFELLIALFPPHLVGYAIIFAECTKIILSGLLIYKMLRLSLFSRPVAVTGSVLYSFSGYMILGGQWHVFSVEAFHTALLMYAYERCSIDGTKGWLIGTFFLIAAFQPFNLYLLCFFFLLYAFMRHWCRRDPVAKMRKSLYDAALAFVAGIGLAAVFFLPALSRMMQTPRGSGLLGNITGMLAEGPFRLESASYYVTLCLRFFATHLEGSVPGWENYLEAPLMYIGLPVILLAPLSFLGSDKRYRVGIGTVLFISAVIILFPAPRFIFWLGTGIYVRFAALMASSFLLIAALHALEQCEQWGRKHLVLLATTFSLCLIPLIFFPVAGVTPHMEITVRNSVLVFLVTDTLLIIGITLHERKKVFMTLLLAAICAEVVTIHSFSLKGRPVVTRVEQAGRSGYNDYSTDAVRLIHESDREFFRIVKEYGSSPSIDRSLNDGMVQGYYGVSAYQSFNHPNLLRFLTTMGAIKKVDDKNSRWIDALNHEPLLLTLLNSKYVLTKQNDSGFLDVGYDRVTAIGDVILLKNSFFLPFGYTYGRSIPKETFERLSPQEKQIAIMRACLIEDGANQQNSLPLYTPVSGSTYTLDNMKADVAGLAWRSLRITTFLPERIEGNISLDNSGVVLFSMPFDNGWQALVDGKREKLLMVNGGLTGVLVEPGEHELKLMYRSPWRTTGTVISLASAIALIMTRRRARRRLSPGAFKLYKLKGHEST